ncbi:MULTISPECIES: hypothetical protein [unclassified Tolypothrix]|uniref:hypothetical protein n=1 Tax=unclassified Tolypothrix TaxID=2649714 RepID=UPI00143C4E28|nr:MULTISPECIES: hypothetical protein [unclassified Tolypothrix]MBE9083998.1 hypothetical protein [Tolypothrix sp. LEGE 11397]UYD38364.1 hypothetical protein HG267_37540 [Tolypothrix sp. PCC 7601]
MPGNPSTASGSPHATFVFSTRGCARRVREASRREAMPQALRHATGSLLLRRSTQNPKLNCPMPKNFIHEWEFFKLELA